MSAALVFIVVVLVLALRGMSAEERARLGPAVLSALGFVKDAILKAPAGGEAFYRALRARTRWAVVTPSIVAAYVLVFGAMVVGPGSFGDPQTLIDWGGNVGPRTTNGEWWRLATSMFVHASLLHLIADTAGLVQVGLVLERLVGRLPFAAIFVASGVLAGIWNLTVDPVAVHTGAAGATFGVYGLLMSTMVWGLVERSTLTIPLSVLKGLWPGVMLSIAYSLLAEGWVNETMKAGLAVGVIGGLLMTGRVISDTPPARRVWATVVATVAVIVALAAPLRGLADVPGEVARLRDSEARTSHAYDQAVDRFKSGRLTAADLAKIADSILSELQSSQASFASLGNVPAGRQAMVSNALEYLRLRQESWRLRAEGLRAGRPRTLQLADAAEQTARTALKAAESSGRQ